MFQHPQDDPPRMIGDPLRRSALDGQAVQRLGCLPWPKLLLEERQQREPASRKAWARALDAPLAL